MNPFRKIPKAFAADIRDAACPFLFARMIAVWAAILPEILR